MRLRALITIDIEAADFVDAADHQRRIESLMHHLREFYPAADLVFRERRLSRRARAENGAKTRGGPLQATGKLKTYVD